MKANNRPNKTTKQNAAELARTTGVERRNAMRRAVASVLAIPISASTKIEMRSPEFGSKLCTTITRQFEHPANNTKHKEQPDQEYTTAQSQRVGNLPDKAAAPMEPAASAKLRTHHQHPISAKQTNDRKQTSGATVCGQLQQIVARLTKHGNRLKFADSALRNQLNTRESKSPCNLLEKPEWFLAAQRSKLQRQEQTERTIAIQPRPHSRWSLRCACG